MKAIMYRCGVVPINLLPPLATTFGLIWVVSAGVQPLEIEQLGQDHMTEPRVVLTTRSSHMVIASCAHKRVIIPRHVVHGFCIPQRGGIGRAGIGRAGTGRVGTGRGDLIATRAVVK